MDRKLLGGLLLLVACGGCRTCSGCYDYLPPVIDGPHDVSTGRAGSAFTGGILSNADYGNNSAELVPDPTPATE